MLRFPVKLLTVNICFPFVSPSDIKTQRLWGFSLFYTRKIKNKTKQTASLIIKSVLVTVEE